MLPFIDVPLHCINEAAYQYQVSAKLIIAILNTEGGKRGLIHHNKNGSVDLGEMQVNSRWETQLKPYHITLHDVLYKPCVNLKVGVWILANSIAESDNLLEGVGNYNSHTPTYNQHYTQKVREKYTALEMTTARES